MENISDSNKLEKITNIIWKIWWFSLYLLIIPSVAFLITYFITSTLIEDLLYRIFIGYVFLLFFQLCFLKMYDKYRKKPFFRNQRNNVFARSHIPSIIQIFSLTISSLFVLFNPNDFKYQFLSILSYSILSLNIFFYLYSKPIDLFRIESKIFVREELSKSVRKPHKIVTLINYITHILFLVTLSDDFYLASIVLIFFNIIHYFSFLKYTKMYRNYFKQVNNISKTSGEQLLGYKKRLVVSYESLIFSLILLNFMISFIAYLFETSLLIYHIVFLIGGVVLIFLGYGKVRINTYFYYRSKQSQIYPKFQLFNAIISSNLIIIASIFIFIRINFYGTMIGFIGILLFMILTYFEKKRSYITTKPANSLYLLSICILLGLFCFNILPLISTFFTLNLQFIIYLLTLYFALEAIKKFHSNKKENILLAQNILSVGLFFLIAYSIYPFLIIEQDSMLNLLIFLIIFFLTLLISFYRLYPSYFKETSEKVFSYLLIIDFLLLDVFCIILLDFFIFSVYGYTLSIFLTIVSSLLGIVSLVAFLELNNRLDIIKKVEGYYYYISWLVIFQIFILILSPLTIDLFYGNPINDLTFSTILGIDLIYLCVIIPYELKLGIKLQKIKQNTYLRFLKINIYAISFLISSLSFIINYFLFMLDTTLNFFLSLILFSLIFNLYSISDNISVSRFKPILNTLVLLYGAYVASYYAFLLSLGTLYVYIVPLIFFCIFNNLSLIYLTTKKIIPKISKKVLLINNLILCIALFFLPTIVTVEFIKAGISVDIVTTVNCSLYILYVSLLIFYFVSKKSSKLLKVAKLLLKSQILIQIILMGTTVFYYPYIFLSGVFLGLLLPVILASIFFYLPLSISRYRGFIKQKLGNYLILINTLFLSISIVLIPSVLGFELSSMGYNIHFIYIGLPTLLIIFIFGNLLNYLEKKLKYATNFQYFIRIELIINYFLITVFLAYFIFHLLFSFINILEKGVRTIFFTAIIAILTFFSSNLLLLKYLKDLRSFYEKNKSKEGLSKKVYQIREAFQNIILHGTSISLSYLFSYLTIEFILPSILFEELCILNYFIIFLLINSLLTPIFHYLSFPSRKTVKSRNSLYIFCFFLFLSSSSFLFVELYFSLFFMEGIEFMSLILYFSISLALLLMFTIKKIKESPIQSHIYYLYLSELEISLIILMILLFPSIFTFLLILGLTLIIIAERSEQLDLRMALYFILTLMNTLKLVILFQQAEFIKVLPLFTQGFIAILYLINLLFILIVSIVFHIKKNNSVERFFALTIFSILVFNFLYSLLNIFIIYCFTISLFIFLFLNGFTYFLKGDYKYKWFIKPSIILFIFNLISWISYTFLFTKPDFPILNLILTFTFTSSITSISFVVIYNDLVEPLRKIFFTISLFSIIVFIPVFLYTFFIVYLAVNYFNSIMIIFCLNIALLLLYCSIAIYKWEISWKIWKIGWYIWIFVPIVNFYLIFIVFSGVDVFTTSLNFFGLFNIKGSFIITGIISTILYIPILYSKVKRHFKEILYFIWGESLALTYWISQNFFLNDEILSNLMFGLLSLLLLTPIFWKYKLWNVLSLIWIILLTLNMSFITIFLSSIEISIELIIASNIALGGVFLIILSLFPNIEVPFSKFILIVSYFIALIGLFLLLFFILIQIFLNPAITLNLTFIMFSGVLFTSRYIKVNQKIIRFVISILFISNLASLTYFSFNLIPNLQVFSLFFALTNLFGSLLVFNHFQMMIRKIDFRAFWLPFGLFLSLSSVSLLYMIIPSYIFVLIGIGALINTVFIQRALDQYKYLTLALYSLCFTFFIYENNIFIVLNIRAQIILGVLIYTLIFQLLINSVHLIEKVLKKKGREFSINPIREKKQIIVLNLICFSVSTILASLFISLLISELILYQISGFFIMFSLLYIFILLYYQINQKVIKYKKSKTVLNMLAGMIFIFIPTFTGILLAFYFISLNIDIILSLISINAIIGGILLVEILSDRYLLRFLTTTTKYPKYYEKIVSLLIYFVYLQLDGISFLFLTSFLDLLESLILVLIPIIIFIIFDIIYLEIIKKKRGILLLVITLFIFFSLIFILITEYTYFSTLLLKINISIFLLPLFLINYLYFMYKTADYKFNENKEDIKEKTDILKFYDLRNKIIGIAFYISLAVVFQESISFMNLFYQFFAISPLLFIISEIDDQSVAFLGVASKYIKVGSWLIFTISTPLYIGSFYIIYLPQYFIYSIPLIILFVNLELYTLVTLLKFWDFISAYKKMLQKIFIACIYSDIIAIPLFFLSTDLVLNFNLVLLTLVIVFLVSHLDTIIKLIKDTIRIRIKKYSLFLVMIVFCIDIFLLLEFHASSFNELFTIFFNLNMALFILSLFFILYFRLFEKKLKYAFSSWFLLFSLSSLLIFQITFYYEFFPLSLSILSFICPILLYPFIFFLEKLRVIWFNFLDKLSTLIGRMKRYFRKILEILRLFITKNLIYIAIILFEAINIVLFVFIVGYLQLFLLNSILIFSGLSLFITDFIYSFKIKAEYVNKKLKYKIIYLSALWITILGIIFNYVTIEYYALVIFLTLTILGAILLPFIYYKEKQENISIKWRFYLTLLFIIVLIITFLLFLIPILKVFL